MSQGPAKTTEPDAPAPPAMAPIPLSRRIDPSAVLALLNMALVRLVRGNRLLILVLLFLFPTVIALLARRYDPGYSPITAEETLIFYMIPQALVPLTVLILTSGMISDEIEEQTLTYLLIRPVPRSLIYLVKLLATILVSAALTFVFTLLAIVVIHWGEPNFWGEIVPGRAARIAGLLSLSTLAYGSLFGLLSLVLRRSLAVGVAYIVVFEGIFANIDFVVRRATVMYHLRILAERWLGLHVETWSIDLEAAPGGTEALLTLLIASAVAACFGAWLFSIREFRVKTPEGT